VVYGPPEESDARQAQVTTLVNNLRNTGGELEIGPCGEYQQLAVLRFSKIFTDDRYNYLYICNVTKCISLLNCITPV